LSPKGDDKAAKPPVEGFKVSKFHALRAIGDEAMRERRIEGL
jgi:hypothetical protein